MSTGQATNYLTFLITGDDSQLEATIERSKRTVAGLFDQQRSSAKALVDSAVYVNGWREALNGASETEKRVSATAVFEGQHRAAKRLVQDADYVAFWTQELDKADAAQRKLASQDAFIGSLKAQSDAMGKTRADLLEMQAAQMGISSQAAPFIAKLREAEQGVGKMGVTAGQTRMALQQLPLQFQDIVVSLQAGQQPLTVALQQGSQLAGSFGGAGAAAKAMGSYILGLVTPFTAAAAAAVVLGVAYYQGSKEQNAYVNAITLTGNAAGVTSGQLQEYARQIGGVVGTQALAADGLVKFIQAGVEGGSELRRYTQTAIEWEKATGQAVDETAKKFASLQDDPLKATLKLNEGTNFLTLSVYEQIKALEDQGRKTEAAQIAMDALDASMRERSKTIEGSLGYIERAWRSITGAAKGAWDAMLNVGRPATLNDQLAEVDKQLNDALANQSWGETDGGAATGRATSAYKKQVQERIDALTAQKWALTEQVNAEEMAAAAQAESARVTKAKIAWDEAGIPLLSKSAKMERELTRERNLAAEAGITGLELEERLAAVRKKYAETGKSGGIKVTDNDLASMRSQLEAAQQYHQQLLVMGPAAAGLNQAERESLKISEQLKFVTDAKTVARLKEKQAVADALAVQLRSNEGLEKSYKAHQESIDSNYKDAESIYERAREQEAANKVFGKGRTAIQEMVLATLQHQLVEAESRDNFDPKYVASLRTKIAAQKEWVTTLGQADYKQVMQRAEELLRNANELARAYEDELALAGKTGLEREKILAQRAVELKYAKELDAISKSSLQDDEKRAAAEVVNNAKRIEMVAATSKATQNHMAKASDEINRSLTDALMRGFESGKSFAQNLADTIKNMFGTMVLRPIISAVMMPVSQGINGVVQQGLNSVGLGSSASQASSNPLGGGLTDWSSWGSKGSAWLWEQGNSLMDAGWGKLGESVMGLGSTVNSVNAYLKGIPGFSGGIGSAAGYLGSIYALSQGQNGTAIGSAIGTAILPGVGTMIGSTLGGLVDSLFGGDDIPRYAASAEYRGGVTSKGWTPGDQWNDALYPMVNGLAGVIGSALDATAKTFGKTAGYELSTTFSKDAENNGIFGTLNITGPDGKGLVDWSKYDKDWGGRWFSDGDAGAKEFMAAIMADVKSAFQAMDLPGWSTQLINAAENIDSISAALQQIGTIKAVFDSLGQTMEMFAGISGDLQTRLLHAAGSIDSLTNAVGAFYQGFYSEQERMDSLSEQLRVSLRSLGSSIDPSIGEHAKVEFRDAVRGAMESGQVELAYQLMAMSSSFATAAEYAQKAATTAAEALQKARDTAVDNARANVQAAIDREKSYWSGIASTSQAAIGSLTSTLGLLTSNARELYGSVDSAQQMLAAQGMAYIEDALTAVRGGASASGFDKLQESISAARGGISGGMYATQFDRERDALVLAGKLSELGELTDSQLTVEERQLKAAQAQIDQLDQALGYWQRQIDGTGQLIDVGLSTVDAIAALAAALAAREQAKLQPQKGPAAGGAWDGVGPYQYGGGNSFLDGVIDYGNQYGSDAYYFIPGVNDYAAKQQSINDIAAITGQSASDLWGSMFGGLGADYWQAVQNASNAGAVVNASDSLDDILRKAGVPGYAVGANYIPNDQLAFLHKGEAVVPAPFNPWAGGMQRMLSGNGMGGNTERLEQLVEQLVEKVSVELQRLQTIVGEGNRAQSDLLDITDQKSEGGSADRVRITNVQELAVAIKEVMA